MTGEEYLLIITKLHKLTEILSDENDRLNKLLADNNIDARNYSNIEEKS